MTDARRVLVIGSDKAFAQAVSDILAAQFPEAFSVAVDPGNVRARPDASALVIDARTGPAQGVAFVERMRAMGFAAGIAIVWDGEPRDGAESTMVNEAARRMGFAVVPPDTLAEQLVPRLAVVPSANGGFADQVMRARRLAAAGEIALRLQHSLNNPIAGIMAEAQLMELDAVTPDQAEALARIVALCRRLVDLIHSLDGVGAGEGSPR